MMSSLVFAPRLLARLGRSARARPGARGPGLLRAASGLALACGLSLGAADAEAQVGAGDPPPPTGNLGDAHAVAPGDTLWDLCAKYLNSPWYWPKIWSYNPQLTNPHWIYPGNEVRFYPGDDELPTEIDVGRAIAVDDDDDLVIPGSLTDDDLVRTVGTIETGRIQEDSIWSAFVGYVSQADKDRAGKVVNSTSEAIMLMDTDRLYVEGDGSLKQGDRLAIYRAVRPLVHPITGESYGWATQIIGGLEIVETHPEVATGRILQAFRPVNRGDFVGPWPESYETRVAPTPASSEAKGYVLETAGDVLGAVAEHHMVYIDRGRSHGVQNGNLFTVYHRGDRYTGETQGLPNEQVGRVMVIDVQDEAATAVVVSSSFEIQVGDKIEMTPGS